MRTVSPIVRTLATAGSVMLAWLISAAPAVAAPLPQRGAAGPVCNAQSITFRKLARHARSYGGPLKRPAALQFGLTDPTARLLRATRTPFDTDEAAIQSDAPAAHIDDHVGASPSLLLLGVLPRAGASAPHNPFVSPRSPRGPPIAA
jgi:hypothetical protein